MLGSPGYIDEKKAEDCAELIRCVDDNTGNLVFQHAINVMLDTDKMSVGAAGISYGDPKAFYSSKYLLFPASNLLRPGVDFRPLAEFMKRAPVPLIILGLGAQANAVAPENEAIETITADPNVQLLADAIRSRAVFVSVLGPFSQRVCEALGIEGTAILGCPSLLLNPSPSLGADMAARLEQAREKADYQVINKARERWLRSCIAQIPFHNELSTALDVGCGAGYFSNTLYELGFSVMGVDLREENIEVCRRRYPDI